MAYSIDLRKRVVVYVKQGGKKTEAAKVFKVSRWCVQEWCKRKELTPRKIPGRKRGFDWDQLAVHVYNHPEALLRERAKVFGVTTNAIWNALQIMKISYKKNPPLPRKKVRSTNNLSKKLT